MRNSVSSSEISASGDSPGGQGPRSAGRVLDLLEAVVENPGHTLTTAATQASLNPSTALRHLRALEAKGYIARDEAGIYSSGPTMRRLASALTTDTALDALLRSAQPILHELAAATGETSYLAISDGSTATYVAIAESARAIRHVGWVGRSVALGGTAIGEALASPGLVTMRANAVEEDITALSCAVSAPIDPPTQAGSNANPSTTAPLAAISIIGPSHRLGEQEIQASSQALSAAAERLGALVSAG